MSTKLFTFLLLPCLIFVAACDSNDAPGDDDDGDGGNNGGATVEVSGAIQSDYSGLATFVTVLGISHAISIVLDNNKGSMVLTAIGPADEGTYAIGEQIDASIFSVTGHLADLEAADGVQAGNFIMTSGSVTISSRSDDRIAGRFSGSGMTLAGDAQIGLSGEFVARCLASLGLCNIGS